MQFQEDTQDRILLFVAIAAAGLIHISIAASQILLGLGVLLLILFRRQLPFPRIWLPLACFFVWTVLADVLSPDPWGGRAQIRKFFVFLFIPLMYGVFRQQFQRVYYVVAAWAAAATASGVWGLVQFLQKYEYAKHTGANFYVTYLARRITGFESHWMTFGALQLSVLSLLLAQYFFSSRKMPRWTYFSIVILSLAILFGWTRSIWLATVAVLLYLIWVWRPRMLVVVPVVVLLAYFVSPPATRSRFNSIFAPHGDTDSNRHRYVVFRTGWEMAKAHPWFGIGPEQIRRQFDAYVPADIRRPLPVGYYGHLHDIYIQYAAERGFPALVFMLWLIGMALWDAARGIRHSGGAPSQQLFILHGTVAVIVGVLVGGIFEFNLGDSEVLMMFVSVLGLEYAALQNIPAVQPVVLSPTASNVSK